VYLGASESRPSPIHLPPHIWPFPPIPLTRGLITGYAMLKLFFSPSKQTHAKRVTLSARKDSPGSSINRGSFIIRNDTYVRTYVLSASSAASERSNTRDQHFALKNAAAVSLFSYHAAASSILDGSPKVIERDITQRSFFLARSLRTSISNLDMQFPDE